MNKSCNLIYFAGLILINCSNAADGYKPLPDPVYKNLPVSDYSAQPTLVDNVLTCITPGSSVDILVTDHGIAVNPARPELAERLQEAGIKVVSIEWLRERARLLTGEPQPIEFTDRVVAVVRYRDGSVIDVVHQVKE